MENRKRKGGGSDRFPLLGLQNHCGWWLQPWVRRRLLLGRKMMTNLDRMLKRSCYSADKGPYSQGYGLPSGHVWLWELDPKEGRVPKNWCLQTVVLEKTLTVHWRLSNSQARRLNQSILKEINPENSLEGLMLKLKLQHFGQFSSVTQLCLTVCNPMDWSTPGLPVHH